MTAIKLFQDIKSVQIGKLDSAGVPLDPSIPGNVLVLPGILFQAATHNLNQTENTIEGQCSEDYTTIDTDMDVDFTLCEVIRPELLAFMLGTEVPAADAALAAAVADIDEGDPLGFLMPALGSNAGTGCCPTSPASAAGFYFAAWRCVGKCDNTSIVDDAGAALCGFQLLGKITRFDLTSLPLNWDATANANTTYTIKGRISNTRMSNFAGIFPGTVSGADPLTPGGFWLTSDPGPFPDECSCDLLCIDDDADRAVQLGAPPVDPVVEELVDA